MRIGESLVREGLISQKDLEIALKEQATTRERLGELVTKKGLVSEETMAPFLASYFKVPYVRLRDIYKEIQPEIIKVVPQDLAYRFTVIPLSLEGNTLTIATTDPLDIIAADTLKLKTGCKIQCAVSTEKEIIEAIDYCYHQYYRMKEYVEEFNHIDSKLEKAAGPDKLRIEASDPPIVQYVNSLLIRAVNSNASDIHIQPKQDRAELSFRIDGVLYHIDSPPKSMILSITTRIKILSNLDIAERRLPQDGRFRAHVGSTEIDVRTSCFPTIYGESVVMRLLNTSSPLLGLEQLGFCSEDLERYLKLITNAYGLILVTGPTGSGKTTTLYTTLNVIKSPEKNMVTLEDPVEYRLPFIQQSQVNADIGFDFARGLRSILRQDPDIIMVGEVRDKETAEIAIHAALTGHLVFSTLHTNDASSAAVRLINMGVEPFLIASSLLGVLAQRLVRCICRDCRKEYAVRKDILDKLSLDDKITKFYKGAGCPKCLESGYKGRAAIFELLLMDEPIRTLLLSRPSNEDIKRLAAKNGMKTLRERGIDKLKSGITTPEEVLRVTQETEGVS
ncbi:MAG TPA: ATPase, T2SS/T4P/T4SS family [Patescibacteria group bacterium]|nr:ATPase, T2SS/T4P/T4SS family [Patescibacteria group bacterium]